MFRYSSRASWSPGSRALARNERAAPLLQGEAFLPDVDDERRRPRPRQLAADGRRRRPAAVPIANALRVRRPCGDIVAFQSVSASSTSISFFDPWVGIGPPVAVVRFQTAA